MLNESWRLRNKLADTVAKKICSRHFFGPDAVMVPFVTGLGSTSVISGLQIDRLGDAVFRHALTERERLDK